MMSIKVIAMMMRGAKLSWMNVYGCFNTRMHLSGLNMVDETNVFIRIETASNRMTNVYASMFTIKITCVVVCCLAGITIIQIVMNVLFVVRQELGIYVRVIRSTFAVN